jgi:hypothetical protein
MPRKTADDPTEEIVEEGAVESFTIEQLSDIVAYNVSRGLLHLPSHITENVPTDFSKE